MRLSIDFSVLLIQRSHCAQDDLDECASHSLVTVFREEEELSGNKLVYQDFAPDYIADKKILIHFSREKTGIQHRLRPVSRIVEVRMMSWKNMSSERGRTVEWKCEKESCARS